MPFGIYSPLRRWLRVERVREQEAAAAAAFARDPAWATFVWERFGPPSAQRNDGRRFAMTRNPHPLDDFADGPIPLHAKR